MRYAQPRHGHRTGIEPVLLAASIPARPGERVIEAGCGAGAALLCLAARMPDLHGLGVECHAATAELARANLAANGLTRFAIEHARIEDRGAPLFHRAPLFHHAMANPPWHDATASASPDPARDTARRARPDLLASWAIALAARVRPGGTLTLILPAAHLAEAAIALRGARFGAQRLLPLWPRANAPARLVLLQGRLGARSADTLLPGLILHEGPQGYSAAAERILRDGAALCLKGASFTPLDAAGAKAAHTPRPGSRPACGD